MSDAEYNRIVNQYADTIYRVALSYSKSRFDAEDVVQNTFVKLLVKEVSFRDEDHLRRWLIRVAVNACKDIHKSFWRKNVDSIDEIPSEPVFTEKKKSDLYYAVMELPLKYRIVVHLFYYEGYSSKEIAGVLHIGETAVRTRLVRARNLLKQMLKEDWQDE